VSPHYSDDELTLYYYGEARRPSAIEAHLDTCAPCAALYREISGTLAIVVAPEVPERGDQYGLEVWQRIRHRLPERDERRFSRFAAFDRVVEYLRWDTFALAGAAAVLVLAAFVAGRTWRTSPPGPPLATAVNTGAAPSPTAPGAARPEGDPARQRILLTAVADHLDRSERVLTDIMNAPAAAGGGHDDISAEQRWAEDLVTTSRLYRQDAIDAGEQSVAGVLDELERTLLEIVHSPSKVTAADLEQIRRRIDAAALLFKVRVMGDELRRREAAPADRSSPRTSTSKIS
jgi:hypothetical protein